MAEHAEISSIVAPAETAAGGDDGKTKDVKAAEITPTFSDFKITDYLTV